MSEPEIRVEVESRYLPEHSDPAAGHYFFTYRVVIHNAGDAAVQLLSRHWMITDANGQMQEVRGPGVVGQQPRIEAGENFEYASFCPLPTPLGSMRGSFTMRRDDGEEFETPVPVFTLATPHSFN